MTIIYTYYEKVKKKMLADFVYLQDNPSTLAHLSGYIISSGGSLDDLNNYAENIKGVTIDEIKSVAKSLMETAPQVTGILYPEGVRDE